MNLLVIILALGTITTILAMVIAISYQAIREHMKFRMAKKEGKAIFRVIGIDNRIKTYMKKMDKSVIINNGTYVTDTDKIVYEKGSPVLTYFEGETFPIDFKASSELIKHKETCENVCTECTELEPSKDPKLLSILFRRAKNSGKLGSAMDEKKMMMIVMTLMVAVVATGFLVFQMKTQVTNMELQLAQIKGLIGAIK